MLVFDYFKAIHIVFIVSWFAGLFYMPRLLIYHTEAGSKSEPEASILKNQFCIMEQRLWRIITTPAMVLTLASGIGMVSLHSYLLNARWFQVKLCFVVLLLLYHFLTFKMYKQVQNNEFKNSSTKLRIWNEIATLLLVAIVFIVILKSAVNWIWGVSGLILLGLLLMLGIRVYKSIRKS